MKTTKKVFFFLLALIVITLLSPKSLLAQNGSFKCTWTPTGSCEPLDADFNCDDSYRNFAVAKCLHFATRGTTTLPSQFNCENPFTGEDPNNLYCPLTPGSGSPGPGSPGPGSPGTTGSGTQQAATCPGAGSGHIQTAIGCIPISNLTLFRQIIFFFALSIASGIALILIGISGFQIATSQGDPRRLQGGRELFFAAVTGLLLLIFAVFVIRIFAVDIFQILPN